MEERVANGAQATCTAEGEGKDIRRGTVSFLLKEEEHKTLLQLEQTFPRWPLRQSTEVPLQYGSKWKAIEAEMKARFSGLDVKKSKLQSIGSRARKQRQFRDLLRFREQHEQRRCNAVVEQLREQVEKLGKQHQEEKAVLTKTAEVWRMKADSAVQELEKAKQSGVEAEERLTKDVKDGEKKIELLQSQLKKAKNKIAYMNKCLKQAEARIAFLDGDLGYA